MMRGGQARRRRRWLSILLALAVVIPVGQSSAGQAAVGLTDRCDEQHTPTQGSCLPTPVQCASGLYNGHWDGPETGMIADCLGAAGRVIHYVAGYAGDDRHLICGTRIAADQLEVTSTGWLDPTLCSPQASDPGSTTTGRMFRPAVSSTGGVVSSVSPLASQAGVSILEAGGNAIDAAAATVFAIGVTRPAMCGIGGGGLLVYRAASGRIAALDFREAAPAEVTPSTFQVETLKQHGSGHLGVGVPGVVAGMAAALDRFGIKRLATVIEPARRLAVEGVPVSAGMATDYLYGLRNDVRLRANDEAAGIYLRDGLQFSPENDDLESRAVLADYAWSLGEIAAHGPDAFYRGAIAGKIVAEMQRSADNVDPAYRGIITAKDLHDYEAIWRTPLTGTYRDHQVVAMPPPTAGGIFTLETLNILEHVDFGTGPAQVPHSSADHFHYASEAQKIAWADRNRYGADPGFAAIPVAELTSKSYAGERYAEIGGNASDYSAGSFSGAQAAEPPAGTGAEPGHTTHVSVLDRHGNAVSVTCSLNVGYGSAVVAPGTGFILNNHMLDFDGPGHVNEPAPGKRPRSSMSPTIVVKDRKAILVTGGAGGTLIPMAVVHSIVNVVDFGMDIARAVDAPRSQSFSVGEGMLLEDGRVAPTAIADLKDRGHSITYKGEYMPQVPQVESVGTDLVTGRRLAVSDPREEWGAEGQ